METNFVVRTSPYLAKFSFWSYWPKCCQPIKLQHSLKCNILRRKWMIKFNFGMQINIKDFFKLMVSFWEMLSILVSVASHAQSTQNKKFALFLQFFQKNVGDKVDFLYEDKCRSFLQVISITLSVCSQAYSKYRK